MKFYVCESITEEITPIEKAAKILDDNNIEYSIVGYGNNVLKLSNYTASERNKIRDLLDNNGITLGTSIRTAQYVPAFKKERKSNKRVGAVVSERIKEATKNISPQKPKGITPTFRYESADRTTVKLEYMFYDIGCNLYDEEGSRMTLLMDDELFQKMQRAFQDECEKLEAEGFIIEYSSDSYKGTSHVRGGWNILAVNYYVEDMFPEN